MRARINYISSFDTGCVLAQKRSMTDSDDAVVTEIIREIVKHGASAGVTFRQTVGGSTPARYPTEAVLTAVRMLAEAADADRSPMGAELRAMIEHVDPNLPIEIVYPGAGPLNCITERASAHGLWWCYRHPENEPDGALTTAIDMARVVAAQEALKSGRTYLVASTPEPARAVYVFASDHPDASNTGIEIMFEIERERGFEGSRRRRTATRRGMQ